MFVYKHAGLADVTTTIRELGERVGRDGARRRRQPDLDAQARGRSGRSVAGRPRPQTLLVFGRDALALRGIYASGGFGFLHDMLHDRRRRQRLRRREAAVGAGDVGADPRAAPGRHHSSCAPAACPATSAAQRDRRLEARWPRSRPSAPAASTSSPTRERSSLVRAWPRAPSSSPARLHPEAFAEMKILVSWSSGKDSAWMLHVLRTEKIGTPAALLTTINEAADRVAMHAVRTELLRAQADAAGLPLVTCRSRRPCPNEVYEERMSRGVPRGGRRRIHARRLRRPLSRGCPALPRRAPGGEAA